MTDLDPERFTLRQAAQARDDFAQIMDELDLVKGNYSPLPPEAAHVSYQLIPVASERAAQPSTIGPPLKTGAESRHIL